MRLAATLVAVAWALSACLQTEPPPSPSTSPQADLAVVGLTLINADSDQPIAGYDPIPSGAVIDYAALGTKNLSIRANTSPSQVGSVRFELNGSTVRIENKLPYAIAGDNNGGSDYYAISPPLALGDHTLTVTPYTKSNAQGTAGTAHTRAFTVTDGTSAPAPSMAVTSLTLINADTDQPVPGFDPIPEGAVIDYAQIGTQNLSIRANTSPSTVGSVRFELNGTTTRIENKAPYAIAGDNNGGSDYYPINPPLAAGTYTLVATPYTQSNAQGEVGAALSRTFQIVVESSGETGCTPSPSQFPGMQISPLSCSEIKVTDPFLLEWDESEGGIPDATGLGTGFTMILPSTLGTGWLPANVTANFGGGSLDVRTTKGLKFTTSNNQDNALGVGLDLPNKALRLTTEILAPPAGTAKYEQAGLWFGISENDYIKFVVISTPNGPTIHVMQEVGGSNVGNKNLVFSLPVGSVTLSLVADPATEAVHAYYRIGTGSEVLYHSFASVPSAWFSKDAAGIDIRVGTRSFGGVFTSHRNASTPLTYRFGNFSVMEETSSSPTPPPPSGAVDFQTWRFDGVDFPTAMVWGPDNRLYVSEVHGAIRRLTIDHAARTVTSIETFTTLGSRTLLGLAIDPASTAGNVILWTSHSSSSLSAGEANSGTITRLSGTGFSTRQDVITGLPRAIANHANNEIQFGPDGRLYIAQGGNTGAGAANDGTSEFGPRPEQPLSAAILVADVKAAGFDGTCRSDIDPNGTQMDATGVSAKDVPCDVRVYASGLRNSYDFVFHSNGSMYATDNGLGVEGTFPKLSPDHLTWSSSNGCEGMLKGSTEISAHNPGTRTDLLLRVQAGDYFGHPNPSRNECVFFGGNPTSSADFPVPTATGETQAYMDTGKYQVGRQPEPIWTRPMFALGKNKSANSIIEYQSGAFCNAMKGDLLVPYYSGTDQVRRIRLAADGLSVVGDETLIRSTKGTGGVTLANPLPIVQDPQGRIYVGETGNNGMVVVFEPIDGGC